MRRLSKKNLPTSKLVVSITNLDLMSLTNIYFKGYIYIYKKNLILTFFLYLFIYGFIDDEYIFYVHYGLSIL